MRMLKDSRVLQIIDSMSTVLAQAYHMARVRVIDSGSRTLEALARRDHLHVENELLRRELTVLRGQRAAMNPHKRPDYLPEQRFEILQLMRLRGWSCEEAARRFVLHPNTIRGWRQAIEGKRDPVGLLGQAPWNQIEDIVKWATHELRRLCPEPEFGTRTIARHLVRSSIKVSRSWVQQHLRQPKPTPINPKRPNRPALVPPEGREPDRLLAPESINETWHLDLATLRVLWFKFTLAALMDGYSRKLLGLRVCRGKASSRYAIQLVNDAVERYGRPKFLITDNGCQFRTVFRKAMKPLNIRPARGKIRQPNFNGKVERLFKTLRIWLRPTLLPNSVPSIQTQLDNFQKWYNQHRPHSAHGCLTPDEVWHGELPPEPIPIRSRDFSQPKICIQRRSCRGDPALPIVDIRLAA
ncbi:MAG: integrase core domain-containing protein [Planctomycetota bacterium]